MRIIHDLAIFSQQKDIASTRLTEPPDVFKRLLNCGIEIPFAGKPRGYAR
jgi:hypothetical protein